MALDVVPGAGFSYTLEKPHSGFGGHCFYFDPGFTDHIARSAIDRDRQGRRMSVPDAAIHHWATAPWAEQ